MSDPTTTPASPAASARDPSSSPPWFDPAVLAATAGGIGRVPFAPGTFGALLGLPLSLATAAAAGWIASRSIGTASAPVVEALLVAAISAIGIPICSRAATVLDRKDPGAIILDEVASMPLALLVVPPDARTPFALAVGFVLLRIFDIGKPFPCRRLERLPSGLGIMADDWAAAAWTAACLAVARWQHWI
jgi:phosphatidylglycerophosphatase A